MIQHKLFYQDPVQTPLMLHQVSDIPILEKDGSTFIKLKLIGWEGKGFSTNRRAPSYIYKSKQAGKGLTEDDLVG